MTAPTKPNVLPMIPGDESSVSVVVVVTVVS